MFKFVLKTRPIKAEFWEAAAKPLAPSNSQFWPKTAPARCNFRHTAAPTGAEATDFTKTRSCETEFWAGYSRNSERCNAATAFSHVIHASHVLHDPNGPYVWARFGSLGTSG